MTEELNSVELRKTGVENNGFIADQGSDVHAISESRKNSQTEDQVYTTTLDSSEDQIPLKPYAGMSKDVLLHFSNQPCYKVPREILFWLIIIATLAIIAATITIIALSPKCLDWWQRSPIYQVYPKSFRDSDEDGFGDLKGVQEKIDHFVYLDVSTVWVAPFYNSTLEDYRYAVVDFRSVDPTFGTMRDFENLLAALHDKGIKLIIDLIPNHTSNKHNWFESSRTRTDKYADYYIWHDCFFDGRVIPPNNWVSMYGGSAWEYDTVRKQCYLHQFQKEQPDLNFYNPDVVNEIMDIIRFWLEKGVDGFTVDAAKFLLEAEHLRDEPQVNKSQNPATIESYGQLYHDYTTTQVGLHDILRDFRHTMNTYSREPGRYRFMGTESNDHEAVAKTMMYYGNSFIQEADFPLNFYLLRLNNTNITGNKIFEEVDRWMKSMPKGKWPHWRVGSPSNSRIASRVGTEYVKVFNMLLLTLPGTTTTYYGEELGMVDNPELTNTTDGSDQYNPAELPEKTPMQWNTNLNAGFSGANTTWLPVNNYTELNVEDQMSEPNSTLNLYRDIIQLRKGELPLHRGWLCYAMNDDNIFAYVREIDGLDKVFMMVLNFGVKSSSNLREKIPELPEWAKIRLSTIFRNNGNNVNMNNINTEAGEGLILEYKTNKPLHLMEKHKNQCFISEKACYSSAFDLLYKNC